MLVIPPNSQFVTEIDMRDYCMHRRFFVFDLNKGKCRYKNVGAFSAFAHSSKQRNYKPNVRNPDLLYHFQLWSEKLVMLECLKEAGAPAHTYAFDESKIIDCDSVWGFFDLIGWDNKTKKWLTVNYKSDILSLA